MMEHLTSHPLQLREPPVGNHWPGGFIFFREDVHSSMLAYEPYTAHMVLITRPATSRIKPKTEASLRGSFSFCNDNIVE